MKFKKILMLLILLFLSFSLFSCQVNLPNLDVDRVEKNISQLIQEEYDQILNHENKESTFWEFEAYVITFSPSVLDDYESSYEIKFILDLQGLLVGIYDGKVNGNNPSNIDGLRTGIKIKVKGFIDVSRTLNLGSYSADICFNEPEISWENMNIDSDTGTGGDNTGTGGDNTGTGGDNTGTGGDNTGTGGDNTGTGGDNTGNNDNDFKGLTVNFAMINDTHGAFIDSNDGYSISRVDTLLDKLESENGDYIKIANGDILQGSYVSSTQYGLPLIKALNLMDFDAFVIGNHEFDWGLDKIALYKDGNLANGEADFPFLGANIFKKGTNTRPSWIDAYTIVEYGDVKVGIIGIIGGTQESSILTDYVQDYDFLDDPSSLVKKYAKELRAEKGCDVVVVASHDHDETLNAKLANYYDEDEIDAIFCAHTHYYISDYITRYDGINIPVVQNRHKNNTVAEVLINVGTDRLMSSYKTQHYYISNSYEMSSDLDSLINEYNDLILESNRVLGNSSSSISKSLLGSYATKAMHEYNYNIDGYESVDLAIINTGGVRSTINSGQIKVSDVFNSFPFNNKVVLVTLKGTYINDILGQSGLYYTKGVTTFNNNSYYKVAVIDYVYSKYFWQNKGFKYSTNIVETDYIMRDLVVDYIDDLY